MREHGVYDAFNLRAELINYKKALYHLYLEAMEVRKGNEGDIERASVRERAREGRREGGGRKDNERPRARAREAQRATAEQETRALLQCVAVCCSVLQCVAVCCSVLQCSAMCFSTRVVCCSTLQ